MGHGTALKRAQGGIDRISRKIAAESPLLAGHSGCGAIGTWRITQGIANPRFSSAVIDVMKAHNYRLLLLYRPATDSMDTACKIGKIANDLKIDLITVGVPKTIDNDLGDPEF